MMISIAKRDTQIPFPMIVNSVNFTGIRKNANPYFSRLPEIALISDIFSHRDSHSISIVKPPDRETKKCKYVSDNQRSHCELLINTFIFSSHRKNVQVTLSLRTLIISCISGDKWLGQENATERDAMKII